MQAVVLVGGFGTRLRPLTLTRPKQMLPILNRPLIEHVVGRLARFGVHDVVLALGYKPDAFAGAYPDGHCAGASLHYAVEPEPLDTAGAVRFAAASAGITERFLVLNGDVLTDLDLHRFVDFHVARGAEATIHLHPVADPSRFGVVPTDAEGRVLDFVEKPPAGRAPTNLINAGTYVLEPSVLDRIPEHRKVSIERETFPQLAADGTLFACPGSSYWIDVGVPAQYLQAQTDMLTGLNPEGVHGIGGHEGPSGRIDGIHPGAQVAVEAKVVRSVLGEGAIVEAGARVEGAVLLPGARICKDAIVLDSVLGEGAVVETGASVTGGSVIGDGEVVAAGAQLGGASVPEPA